MIGEQSGRHPDDLNAGIHGPVLPGSETEVGREIGERLPHGTVTFLLTDIENSTGLWEENPREMESALARHDAIVRAGVERLGGVIFKTTGDGAFAVFTAAPDALSAALEVQRELASERWPESSAIRVRMSLLTGVAQQRNGDYFGRVLNRTSRLLALASGGQVVLGASTAELVRDHLPPDAELRTLGPRQLRGLKQSIEVYRISAPFLSESFDRPVPEVGADPAYGRSSAPIQIQLLGPFSVRANGRDLRDSGWTRQKARQLLKCLLTRPYRRMATDEAIDAFWPEADVDAAQKTLRSTLSALRAALGASGAGRGQGIVTIQQGAVLIPADAEIWVDADEFERLLAQARSAVDPLPLLEQADALYAGDYLANDLYEPWAEERREALRRQWVDLQHRLAEARERQDDIEGATGALRRVLSADPCDERAGRALMLLLGKHGRRSEALRVHDRLVEALRDIQAEPEGATSILRQQIAAGHRGVAEESPFPVSQASPPAPATSLDGIEAEESRSSDHRSSDPRPYLPSYPFPIPDVLIGRTPELNTAEGVLERGREGCQVLLLSAPAGTGKSALAGAVVRRAQRLGYLCLVGGGYEQQGAMPLGPFHDAFADYLLAARPDWVRADLGTAASDLAEIVPELRQHLRLADEPDHARPDQARLFGSVHTLLRTLGARWPVVLCLEDLHAADAATLDLIRFLSRQARRQPLVLLGTFRSDEVQPTDPLGQLQAMLQREGAEQINLQPLKQDDSSRMIDAILDGAVSPRLAAQLHDATGGNPLFLEQFVLALHEEGRVDRRDGVWQPIGPLGQTLPHVTKAVIGQRCSRLTSQCLETLTVAAVLGQHCDEDALVAVLHAVTNIDVLEGLDESLATKLLLEAPNGYVFSHGLVRDYLYSSLSGPRRMLLHGQIGRVLEQQPRFRGRPSELAYHFCLAGSAREMQAKALRYSLDAGRAAAKLFGHRDALQHFDNAARLLPLVAEQSDQSTSLEVVLHRARTARSMGYWSRSLEHAREALPLAPSAIERAEMHEIACQALLQMSQTSEAFEEAEAGLAVLRDLDADAQVLRARLGIQQHQAQVLFLRGRGHALLALGKEMLADAQRFPAPKALIAAHKTLASGSILLGRIDDGIRNDEIARDLALEQGDDVDLAVRESNLAVDHAMAGHFTIARQGFERAVDLCRAAGAEYRAVNSLLWLGRIDIADGDLKAANEHAKLSVQLAEDAGVRFLPDCHNVVGLLRLAESKWDDAAMHFRRSLELRTGSDHPAGRVASLVGLGEVQLHQGEWSNAREAYLEAVEVAESMDSGPYLVAAIRGLGRTDFYSGQEATAAERVEYAMELARRMPSSIEHPLTQLALAEFGRSTTSTEKRLSMTHEALQHGLPMAALIAADSMLVDLYASLNELASAGEHARAALENAQAMGSPYSQGLAWTSQARLAIAADEDTSVVTRCIEEARQWFERAASALGHQQLSSLVRDYGIDADEAVATTISLRLDSRPRLIADAPESL